MVRELEETLEMVRSGRIAERPFYRNLPADLLKLRHVALSGDGEPAFSPNFNETVEGVLHVRARAKSGYFKIVLLSNGSRLAAENVTKGLSGLAASDEIWIKLDAGTQEYMNRVNRSDELLDTILANIIFVARQRPVVIQSLFPEINGVGPFHAEIEAYCQSLRELAQSGAQIILVQIYSATRPTPHSECGHLPLRELSRIARRVREVAGLRAEIF
jgi:wyosine [tRNA(Phe)-imidazoG37] synthetase (radical SAM superfamily)